MSSAPTPAYLQDAVTVPQFNHTTVQNNLLKILLEYQNNGWLEAPEYKIYQQRLSKNLSFLATVADAVVKKIPFTKQTEDMPDLSPIVVPERIKALSKGKEASGETSSVKPTQKMPSSIYQGIKPPAMVQDPNPNIARHLPYTPVQPFVMPPNIQLPPGQTNAPYLDDQTAENVLKHRLQLAEKERPTKRFANNDSLQEVEAEEPFKETSRQESISEQRTDTAGEVQDLLDEFVQSPKDGGDLDEDDGEYVPPEEEPFDPNLFINDEQDILSGDDLNNDTLFKENIDDFFPE